ncbi:hypothetical protein B0A48_03445 [Cryoendolithus antarcticus]|uniref:N-acetyltransferase domain-containing protein n=1 Tax=Cryoendolithus antarcticus TaxID=1507870 RepID=A0A1V8TKF4_9PEZI|nr:hypothetical protein B0A48_03445 [Cryoendolithus antarcticus]
MASSILIQPCTTHDGLAIATNNVGAFWRDASWILIWGTKTETYVASQAALRWPYNLLQNQAHHRFFKGVDSESGKLLGFVRWDLPDVPGASELWIEGRVPSVELEVEAVLKKAKESADWEYIENDLDAPIGAAMRRLKEGQGYLVLDYLAVHPDNSRKGVGTALVEHGLRKAADLGLDVFVHGKDAGLPLYSKCGFELLERLWIDDAELGGRGYGAHLMVWRCSKTSVVSGGVREPA